MAISNESKEAWAKFLDDISWAREQLDCSPGPDKSEAWFRGHSRGNYQLLPSLFRSFSNREDDDVWQTIWDKESDLFWEFWARGRELYSVVEDDWDILFSMQHYGTPTRLLDWTEVLGVAVYFATLGVDEDQQGEVPPCVWVMNPYRLNEYSCTGEIDPEEGYDLMAPRNLGWDEDEKTYYTYSELLAEDEISWDLPLAIYPRQRNPRLHAQRGWFTIHGDVFHAMEEMEGHENYLFKVELPFAALPAARDFLETAGIDHYLLFADLPALSLRLVEKNGLLPRKMVKELEKGRVERRHGLPKAKG